MKKILLICVNYNSYNALQSFLESVNHAAKSAIDVCSVRVLIADNSTHKQIVDINQYTHIESGYYACENAGYIGTVEKLLDVTNWRVATEADFFIISNVDICLSEDFFCQLSTIDGTNVGWVVPRIYAVERKREDNPQAILRYSKIKLLLLYILYSFPFLYKCYRQTIFLLIQNERNYKTSIIQQQQEIYAGNGSIFIFTKEFLKNLAPFHYPCFLYGEELFFAELVRSKQLKTIFYPNLYIENNTPNVSTKELGFEQRCRYSAKAIKYIIQTYY